MAYTQFDSTHPDASSNGTTFATECRQNFQAMRDALILGSLYGWNYSKTDGTGTAEQPQYVFFKKSAEWLRGTLTWGTSGGADGNVTVGLWEYSSNSGSSYDTIGTLTIAYDASGNVTTTTWS